MDRQPVGLATLPLRCKLNILRTALNSPFTLNHTSLKQHEAILWFQSYAT